MATAAAAAIFLEQFLFAADCWMSLRQLVYDGYEIEGLNLGLLTYLLLFLFFF